MGIISAEKGLGSKYISAVSQNVTKLDFVKTFKIAKLFHDGKLDELNALVKKNPQYEYMVGFLKDNARVTYVSSISEGKANPTQFMDNLTTKPRAQIKKQLDYYADIWADAFELAVRASAYKVVRADTINKLTEQREAKLGRKLNREERNEVDMNARSSAAA